MPKILKARSIANAPHIAALRYRDYRSTWIANMFSGAGMWTFVVASSWLVLERSDSSGWVGVVTFASMIPYLVVSPFGGLLADRFDRRNLALATLTASALNVAVLAALAVFDAVQLWHVAVLAFAGGVLRATQEPAIQALIPNQVPRADLLNAITLNSATRLGSQFFGLLMAAPLLAVDFIGVTGVLALSATLHALGAIQMSRTRTVSRGESGSARGVVGGIGEGLVYVYSARAIALFMILVALHCSLTMSFDSVLPIFSRERLDATDGSILGYLVMAFGVGSLAGTLLMAGVRSERKKGRYLIWMGLGSGLAPLALALSGNLPLALLAIAGMGASQATFMALTNTYVQEVAPDRLRGRIASLYGLHAGGVMAFANLGYGFLADAFSAPPILFATALIFIVVLVGLSASQPVLRRVYGTGQVAAAS